MSEKHAEKIYIGKVIFLNHRRGYGWIKCEHLPEDVFFHFKSGPKINTPLEIGSVIRFELDSNKQNLIAKNLDALIE